MFAAAARIAKAVGVPVTVDAESGYGLSGAELAGRLLDAGAVGCNFEDTDHATGEVRPVAEQAERIAALREAAGDGLVINARVDSFRGVDPKDHLADGIARARAYLEAGADCVYPIHLRTPEVLAAFVQGVGGAVNAPAWPGSPGLGGLAELGVARISLGGGLWQYVRKQLEADARGGRRGKTAVLREMAEGRREGIGNTLATAFGVSACSVGDGFLGARAGQGADLHLGVLLLVVLLGQDGAQPAQDERGRDRDEARVAQREPARNRRS